MDGTQLRASYRLAHPQGAVSTRRRFGEPARRKMSCIWDVGIVASPMVVNNEQRKSQHGYFEADMPESIQQRRTSDSAHGISEMHNANQEAKLTTSHQLTGLWQTYADNRTKSN